MSKLKKEILKVLKGWEETVPEDVAPLVSEFLNEVEESLIADFLEQYEMAGTDWGFSKGSKFVRLCLEKVIGNMVKMEIKNIENLKVALAKLKEGKVKRVVILSNHLSYSDANTLAVAFSKTFEEFGLEDSLSVIAGPKVFSHPLRKFASMHFHSLLIAQSQSVSTFEVPYPIRVIARAATQCVEDIKEKVKLFLVFPEGKRSREGSLNQFLQGVYRLIDTNEDVLILPLSIVGGDKFLPISFGKLNRADIAINIGEAENIRDIVANTPISPTTKQDIMDYLGKKVAALHPEERRGFYS
ncbi:MAG: lysophospholipid acyltransferase family protein [bacterium]